ncbi:MAG TPA: hypothetical protein VER55_08660 [Ardenticatenaceae bacterium]|nr:hypothetical protein [Ardenticatenaceae bacterium]
MVRGSELLTGFLATLSFVLAQSISLLFRYWMVAGRAKVGRTFDEFLRFSSIFLGFTIPIGSTLQALWDASPVVGVVVFIVLSPLLLV